MIRLIHKLKRIDPPKGHHKHIGDLQIAYSFVDIERLFKDFRRDIEATK